jgi:hypothetical protein
VDALVPLQEWNAVAFEPETVRETSFVRDLVTEALPKEIEREEARCTQRLVALELSHGAIL